VGNFRSAHEISHQRADKKHEAKKFPWQQDISEEAIAEETKTPKRYAVTQYSNRIFNNNIN